MSLTEQRAQALARLLEDDGFNVDTSHFPPTPVDELDRWYLSMRPVPGGPVYAVQFDQNLADGTVRTTRDETTTKPADPVIVERIERLRQQAEKHPTQPEG